MNIKIDWCRVGLHDWIYEIKDEKLSRFCSKCGRQERQLADNKKMYRIPNISLHKRIYGTQEKE